MRKTIWTWAVILVLAFMGIAFASWRGDLLKSGLVNEVSGALKLDGAQIQAGTIPDGALATGNVYSNPTASYAFGTADHQDDIDVSDLGVIFLDSSSYAITIGGFSGGVAGQTLLLAVKDAGNTITIENNETSGDQEIMLDGAGDVTLNVNEGVSLVCDGSNWWEINR